MILDIKNGYLLRSPRKVFFPLIMAVSDVKEFHKKSSGNWKLFTFEIEISSEAIIS